MDLGLKGRVALVTGGSRGIGKGIAEGLVAEGCNVVICAREEDRLHEAARELSQGDAEVMAVRTDITDPVQVASLVDRIGERFGGLDILVNNVGGNRRKLFEEATDADWTELVELNVLSAFRLSRAAIPLMRGRGGGSIIFISSIFGREKGGPGLAIYNTTKSALISAAGILALELAGEGIRVNSVAPGSIRFPGGSWDRRCNEDPEGMAEFIEANLPLGRFGTVEEVANVVAFLASERASLLTGTCIPVDGAQGRSLI